jgi:predicted Zn-dependent protease
LNSKGLFYFSLFVMPLVILLCGICLAVAAQNRHLPKATLPTFARSAGDEANLPGSYGVHLTPGLNRPRNAAAQRYDPGEPDLSMATVRWESNKMPLLIWISPGLQLPDCPASQLKSTRVDEVTEMLQSSEPLKNLKQATGWTPETNDDVAAGIEQWRQFQGEGLFRFAFTDDPRDANICVFFVDAFREGTEAGGIMVGGNTAATVYPIAQAHSIKIKQKPVIIELSTLVNSTPQKMTGAAAHEFGHALGIKAHSPYREDIMYVDRVVDQLSPADKATIRWLYRQTPKYVL